MWLWKWQLSSDKLMAAKDIIFTYIKISKVRNIKKYILIKITTHLVKIMSKLVHQLHSGKNKQTYISNAYTRSVAAGVVIQLLIEE